MRVLKYRRRLPHILIARQVYFLTFRLAKAQVQMLTFDERNAVLAHVSRMSPGHCLAWVVMPDHVHLLYKSQEEEDPRKTLKALKGSSSRTLATQFGRRPPVWQEETFDRIIRDEKELQETWKYLEHNPVRKGLAPTPEQYPWSSASARANGRAAARAGVPAPPK